MKRHPRAVVPQIRVFICPVCGTKISVTKVKGQTSPGHRKNIYCYVCRKVTKHEQLE